MFARLSLPRHALLGTAAALALTASATAQVTVLPPHASVAGRSIADYSASWWQWALAFTAPNDPISSPDEAFASLNQSGRVFFLAGGGTSTRTLSIRSDKFVLVPVVNGELSQLELPGLTPAEVRQATIDLGDLFDTHFAEIDGVPVSNVVAHRELSRQFRFTAAPGNPIGVPAGDSGAAYADGYWLMLAPMPVGTHVIHFGGGITQFGFSVDTTDTITVYCAADFDRNGAANTRDFFEFLVAFLAHDSSADFNGDGAIDIRDFFDFVAAFFAGC